MIFEVRHVGLMAAAERFRVVGERMEDLRPAWLALEPVIRRGLARGFDTQGLTLEAGAWRPLKASTRRRKGNQRALVISGKLRRSVTSKGARNSLTVVRRDRLVIGTRSRVAATQARHGRQAVSVPRGARPAIGKAVESWITRGQGGAA